MRTWTLVNKIRGRPKPHPSWEDRQNQPFSLVSVLLKKATGCRVVVTPWRFQILYLLRNRKKQLLLHTLRGKQISDYKPSWSAVVDCQVWLYFYAILWNESHHENMFTREWSRLLLPPSFCHTHSYNNYLLPLWCCIVPHGFIKIISPCFTPSSTVGLPRFAVSNNWILLTSKKVLPAFKHLNNRFYINLCVINMWICVFASTKFADGIKTLRFAISQCVFSATKPTEEQEAVFLVFWAEQTKQGMM